MHGGKTPAVVRKAAERKVAAEATVSARLRALAGEAVATLEEVARSGEKDADRLRASEAILNRAGFPEVRNVNADVTKHDDVANLDDEVEGLLFADEAGAVTLGGDPDAVIDDVG